MKGPIGNFFPRCFVGTFDGFFEFSLGGPRTGKDVVGVRGYSFSSTSERPAFWDFENFL